MHPREVGSAQRRVERRKWILKHSADPPPERWWEGFADPTLNALIERATHRSFIPNGNALVGEIEPLLTLLRRFATEAAREEARRYCEDLVAEDEFAFADEWARAAA